MSRFVRSSKVRHVYCEPAKQDKQYSGLRLSSATGDHFYIKANTKYFAVPVQTGGGSLAVIPLENYGKLNPTLPVLDGHIGSILDFDFDPFRSQVIATGGDDCTVKVWEIPEGGMTENLVDPLVNLIGHRKKVSILRFHPSADGVLASGSADTNVKIWDVQRGECKVTCTANDQLVQDVVWSYDGSTLATSSKDRMMRLFDPRTGEVTAQVEAHTGTKTSKLTYLGSCGRLCSVGFTRSSKRQFKIWDPKNLSEPLATCDIDQAAGVMMPFFDEGTNLLFIGSKGEGLFRYYEMSDKAPWQYHVQDYRGTTSARGLAMLPKTSCDVTRCEVSRFLKLTKDSVEPLSFICPRKSEIFQEDLFPPCYAGKSSLTCDEFFDGKNKDPILKSMNPSDNTQENQGETQQNSLKVKTAKQLELELENAKQYIQLLTKELETNDIQVPPQLAKAS